MAQIESAIKRMLDLSVSHMTRDDVGLMSDCHGHDNGDLPRIIQHAHGFIVFVSSDPDFLRKRLSTMADDGFSEAVRMIYRSAAQRDMTLINFDQDAAVIEGLPTFDW